LNHPVVAQQSKLRRAYQRAATVPPVQRCFRSLSLTCSATNTCNREIFKGAVEILKLNAMAHLAPPNVYDSVSDAYLADGQKELALQDAQKAVEPLANDTADGEERRKWHPREPPNKK
jgi:hypothetical protein